MMKQFFSLETVLKSNSSVLEKTENGILDTNKRINLDNEYTLKNKR